MISANASTGLRSENDYLSLLFTGSRPRASRWPCGAFRTRPSRVALCSRSMTSRSSSFLPLIEALKITRLRISKVLIQALTPKMLACSGTILRALTNSRDTVIERSIISSSPATRRHACTPSRQATCLRTAEVYCRDNM